MGNNTYTFTVGIIEACERFHVANTTPTTLLMVVTELVRGTGHVKPVNQVGNSGRVEMIYTGTYEMCVNLERWCGTPPDRNQYNLDGVLTTDVMDWLQADAPSFQLVSRFVNDVSVNFTDPAHEALFKMRYNTEITT